MTKKTSKGPRSPHLLGENHVWISLQFRKATGDVPPVPRNCLSQKALLDPIGSPGKRSTGGNFVSATPVGGGPAEQRDVGTWARRGHFLLNLHGTPWNHG